MGHTPLEAGDRVCCFYTLCQGDSMITLEELRDADKREQFDTRVAARVKEVRNHVPINRGIKTEEEFLDLLKTPSQHEKANIGALVKSLDRFD